MKNKRIRQTRTAFQKVFDKHPEYIQPYSSTERIPEIIHISIALLQFNYQEVKSAFFQIADFVNKKHISSRFIFTLSSLIDIMGKDESIQLEINKTCFAESIKQLFLFYPFTESNTSLNESEFSPELLIKGYKNILDPRSNNSILCKYLLMQYNNGNRHDVTGLFQWETAEEVLEHKSRVIAGFGAIFGMSNIMNLDFCEQVWDYNYMNAPFIEGEDKSNVEKEHYNEFHLDEILNEFKDLYNSFKKINLLSLNPRFITEVNKGFIARICNLSLEVVESIANHKAEIAEIKHRIILENYILYSWLQKKKDPSLYQRFRNYSLGRDRFLAEKFAKMAESTPMKDKAEWIKEEVGKEMGSSHIFIAEERGEIFDLKLDKMADEVWGEGNGIYFIYKRLSEVIHGHWRVIAKYHLTQSMNPMHNGLFDYNHNNNSLVGLVPAFDCLGMACKTLLITIDWAEEKDLHEIIVKIEKLDKRIGVACMAYIQKYQFK